MRTDPGVDAFVAKGFPRRAYFAHDVAWLTKHYPDTFVQLERRSVPEGVAARGQAYQLNLYARDLAGFPNDLFSDPTINWHQQQLGRKGLVAAAGLYQNDGTLFVTLLQSDLCQQIFRHPALRRACKTRLENKFGAWGAILWNAVLDFALARGARALFSPTAAQILASIKKPVQPALFHRVYDSPSDRYGCSIIHVGGAEYWAVPLSSVRDRVVPLMSVSSLAPTSAGPPTICLFHDIEADVDTAVSRRECRDNLARMLAVEARRGVRVTYTVLGTLFNDLRPMIVAHGHDLAFHTYDHVADRLDQLPRVRELDLQVRGYRPARSVLTAELAEYRLSYFNFEWLLCSALTLGFAEPRIERGVAKLPVHLDDYLLHSGELDYPAWRARLRRLVVKRQYVAIGLHDCYARHWLDHYDDLLAELSEAGTLKTCDEIADDMFLASDMSTDTPSSSGDAVGFSINNAALRP